MYGKKKKRDNEIRFISPNKSHGKAVWLEGNSEWSHQEFAGSILIKGKSYKEYIQ